MPLPHEWARGVHHCSYLESCGFHSSEVVCYRSGITHVENFSDSVSVRLGFQNASGLDIRPIGESHRYAGGDEGSAHRPADTAGPADHHGRARRRCATRRYPGHLIRHLRTPYRRREHPGHRGSEAAATEPHVTSGTLPPGRFRAAPGPRTPHGPAGSPGAGRNRKTSYFRRPSGLVQKIAAGIPTRYLSLANVRHRAWRPAAKTDDHVTNGNRIIVRHVSTCSNLCGVSISVPHRRTPWTACR